MTKPDPLTLVADAFTQWREDYPAPRRRVPDSLRRQAVALLTQYSNSRITRALRISGGQLAAWRQQEESPPTAPEFVPLPQTPSPPPAGLSVEVAFPGGCRLRLDGHLSADLLRALAQSLLLGTGAGS